MAKPLDPYYIVERRNSTIHVTVEGSHPDAYAVAIFDNHNNLSRVTCYNRAQLKDGADLRMFDYSEVNTGYIYWYRDGGLSIHHGNTPVWAYAFRIVDNKIDEKDKSWIRELFSKRSIDFDEVLAIDPNDLFIS